MRKQRNCPCRISCSARTGALRYSLCGWEWQRIFCGKGRKKKGHLFFTCPLSIEPTLFNMFLTCHVMSFVFLATFPFSFP